MPRKDGTPTTAERMNAARIEANRKFIAGLSDDDLATVEIDHLLHDEELEMVRRERERRAS